jgi:hypothetical protein
MRKEGSYALWRLFTEEDGESMNYFVALFYTFGYFKYGD